jgi:predicted amidohydrolase YtcJ
MLQNGVPLAFGSDSPVEAPQPLVGNAGAGSRQDATRQPAGGWQPRQTITREQALAAYTAGAAYAGFAEGRFGEIKPGQRADFLFVDRDPLTATPEDLRRTLVLETWIGGQKVYSTDNQVPKNGASQKGPN